MIASNLDTKQNAIISKVIYSTANYYAIVGMLSFQTTHLIQIFAHRTFSSGNSWIFHIIWGVVGIIIGVVLGFTFGAIHGILMWMICGRTYSSEKPHLFRLSVYLVNLVFPTLCVLGVILTNDGQVDITFGVVLALCFIAASLEISRQFMSWWTHIPATTPND